MKRKYKIHFKGGSYDFELYNYLGSHIYELDEAKEEAQRQYPEEEYEIYNGDYGFSTFKD